MLSKTFENIILEGNFVREYAKIVWQYLKLILVSTKMFDHAIYNNSIVIFL